MASVECIYNLKMDKLQLPVDIETITWILVYTYQVIIAGTS